MSLSLLLSLCFLLLCAGTASADAAADHPSCSIAADWNLTVTGRSALDFYAVLPEPYCLFISSRTLESTADPVWVYYAVDFVSGSLAWQWGCSPPPAGSGSDGHRSSRGSDCGLDMSLQIRGGVVPSLSAAGRVYVSAWQQGNASSGYCDVMSALDAATGQTLYEDALCSPQLVTGSALVMPFQLSSLPAGEELLVHAVGLRGQAGLQIMLRVLNGSTGACVSTSSMEVSDIYPAYLQPIDNGREGLFALLDRASHGTDVYQLQPDGSVRLAASKVTALPVGVPSYLPSLASQPALNLDSLLTPHQVIATDVLTNATRWSSADPFLVGAGWGSNGSFSHFSTAFVQLSVFPELFVVLNTAAGPNVSILAAVALYTVGSGKQLALTPTFAFGNLTGLGSNPTMWELEGERALVLRADDLWYVLDIPSLVVRTAGRYASWDAAFHSNLWIVSVDGSYVGMPYGAQQDSVRGYRPRQTYTAPALSSSSSPSCSAAVKPLPAASASSSSTACPVCSSAPPAPETASSSTVFSPLVIGLLCIIAALLLALLLISTVAFRRRLIPASGAGGDGAGTNTKREKLLSDWAFHR